MLVTADLVICDTIHDLFLCRDMDRQLGTCLQADIFGICIKWGINSTTNVGKARHKACGTRSWIPIVCIPFV